MSTNAKTHIFCCFATVEAVWFCDPPLFVAFVRRPWFRTPLQRYPPGSLDQYRACMREHCRIPNTFNRNLCLACRAPLTSSAAGEFEHRKTGVCEACWDILACDSDAALADAGVRCTRLAGPIACKYVGTWIQINRVAAGGTLRCHPELARHIIEVATGLAHPPNLWLPNERP